MIFFRRMSMSQFIKINARLLLKRLAICLHHRLRCINTFVSDHNGASFLKYRVYLKGWNPNNDDQGYNQPTQLSVRLYWLAKAACCLLAFSSSPCLHLGVLGFFFLNYFHVYSNQSKSYSQKIIPDTSGQCCKCSRMTCPAAFGFVSISFINWFAPERHSVELKRNWNGQCIIFFAFGPDHMKQTTNVQTP